MRASTAVDPRPDPDPVVLIDDHRVFADVQLLGIDADPGLRCAGVAHPAAEGLALAAAVAPAVAVIDLEFPDGCGIDLTRKLLDLRPEPRVVILTAYTRPDLARQAREAGAAAFIGKDSSLREVLTAVHSATPACPVLAPGLDRDQRPVRLTPREHDVLRQLAQGMDAHRTAAALSISLSTTRDHIKTLIRKLGAHNQLGAVVEAQRLGLLTIGRRY